MLLAVAALLGWSLVAAQEEAPRRTPAAGSQPPSAESGSGDSTAFRFGGAEQVLGGYRVKFLRDLYPVAVIEDRRAIKVFNEEFLLADEDTLISEIKIIDLNRNGFEQGDFLIVEPAGEPFYLHDVPERIYNLMKEWPDPVVGEIHAEKAAYIEDALAALEADPSRDSEIRRCKYCLLKAILYGLQTVYYNEQVRIFFERSREGMIRATIWDYVPQDFLFSGCRAMTDTIPSYDILQVTRSDTMLVAERNYFDMIFVRQTRADTLFVEPRGLSGGRYTWEAR